MNKHGQDPAAGGASGQDETPAENPFAAAEKEAPEELAEAYRQVMAEKKDLYERLLRKQAEMDNMRKRVEREKEDFQHHATADLIRALLPTLDSLERAARSRKKGVPDEFYQGLELIHRDFLEVLSRAGVSVIQTEGQSFDPHVHQAIETVESDRHRDQEIVEELQKGYILRHRLLRPAIVRVAVGKAGGPSANGGNEEKE